MLQSVLRFLRCGAGSDSHFVPSASSGEKKFPSEFSPQLSAFALSLDGAGLMRSRRS